MFIDESLLTNREGARSKQNLEKGLVYLDPLMKPSSQIALKLPEIRPPRQMNLSIDLGCASRDKSLGSRLRLALPSRQSTSTSLSILHPDAPH